MRDLFNIEGFMMTELVSVIITTYKRDPKIVFRAINSVIHQTYANIEIIVVDDSPSDYQGRDFLQNEIKKLAGEIKYIQHTSNMGACVARNTGLTAAKGEYVAFLDDDDEWLCGKIEQQMNQFQDPQTAIVYCGSLIENDVTGEILSVKLVEHSGYVYDELIFNNFIGSTSFPLIKRKVLVEVGGFDPQMRASQDYDVWLKIAKNYKVNYVNLPLVKYHIHGEERISTNYQARISGQERLIQKNMEYLVKNPKAWWWRLLRLSIQYSHSVQLKKAVHTWARGCTKQPLRIVTNIRYLTYILYYYLKERYAK